MSSTDPARRSFVVLREIPGLLVGALRGDAVALRRILGARRTGRWGLLLAGLGVVAAAPSLVSVPILALLHLALALYIVIPRPGSLPLGVAQELVLSLWTAAPLLLGLASLRLILAESILPAVLAILLGHLLVWRGLRRGLG